jgi:hypothetical protein
MVQLLLIRVLSQDDYHFSNLSLIYQKKSPQPYSEAGVLHIILLFWSSHGIGTAANARFLK